MIRVSLAGALSTACTSGALPGRTSVKRRGSPTASGSAHSPPASVKSVRRSAFPTSRETARTSTQSTG